MSVLDVRTLYRYRVPVLLPVSSELPLARYQYPYGICRFLALPSSLDGRRSTYRVPVPGTGRDTRDKAAVRVSGTSPPTKAAVGLLQIADLRARCLPGVLILHFRAGLFPFYSPSRFFLVPVPDLTLDFARFLFLNSCFILAEAEGFQAACFPRQGD